MHRLADGEVQVLCCTTIIETGIDIPNVNTLIVEDADRLGLSQLHQIRGRVGRSPRHAYAYLTYKTGKVLSEVASKRLTAIREFAEFGSGFKIAMRDLEIRGAGNVLGSEQSGHMISVGYDMYLRLLEEAVLEERGEAASASSVDCVADLAVTANIPDDYVKNPGIRMDLYRRMAALQDDEEAADLVDELIDRFGDVPAPVHTLIRIALLRAKAGAKGITELQQKQNRLIVRFKTPDFARVAALCGAAAFKGRLLFSAGDAPYLSCRLLSGEPVLDTAQALAETY
jgi:transcription-repair coupling factor (superfamily II helicase)